MSTNFYINCIHCKQLIIHLGKISNQKFLSNFNKEDLFNRITNLNHNEEIVDEYGKIYLRFDFIIELFCNTTEFETIKGNFS